MEYKDHMPLLSSSTIGEKDMIGCSPPISVANDSTFNDQLGTRTNGQLELVATAEDAMLTDNAFIVANIWSAFFLATVTISEA